MSTQWALEVTPRCISHPPAASQLSGNPGIKNCNRDKRLAKNVMLCGIHQPLSARCSLLTTQSSQVSQSVAVHATLPKTKTTSYSAGRWCKAQMVPQLCGQSLFIKIGPGNAAGLNENNCYNNSIKVSGGGEYNNITLSHEV